MAATLQDYINAILCNPPGNEPLSNEDFRQQIEAELGEAFAETSSATEAAGVAVPDEALGDLAEVSATAGIASPLTELAAFRTYYDEATITDETGALVITWAPIKDRVFRDGAGRIVVMSFADIDRTDTGTGTDTGTA